MRVIVAGSRTIKDYSLVEAAIAASGFEITELVSGKEPHGVDYLGERWAKLHSIPVKPFPAPWTLLGRGAGHARNEVMARYADALVAIWDGKSPGTSNMIDRAREYGLKVYIERQSIP